MNNETKILAMSLLAILANFNKKERFSTFWDLEILKDYNKKIDTKVSFDSDWDEIKEKIEIIKDEELQKIIIQQEKVIKDKSREQVRNIEELMKENNKSIKMIEEILNQILEKKLEKDNQF